MGETPDATVFVAIASACAADSGYHSGQAVASLGADELIQADAAEEGFDVEC